MNVNIEKILDNNLFGNNRTLVSKICLIVYDNNEYYLIEEMGKKTYVIEFSCGYLENMKTFNHSLFDTIDTYFMQGIEIIKHCEYCQIAEH